MEVDETPLMLPPPPGSFIDREELIQHVGEFAISQGYVVTIKQSKKEKVVVLGCDRGGVYRDRRKHTDDSSGENTRKRKSGSRLTNCPFELVGKKEDGLWFLTVRNGSHNHEPMRDISEHPSARRFSEKEVILVKEMTDAGLKPRQILKRLRQTNPELLSTPKHVYNVKAKLRQGNLAVRRLMTLRTTSYADGNSELPTSSEPSWKKRYPPRYPNLIGGRFIESHSSTFFDVLNPATQQVVGKVPLSTSEELKAAVSAAKRALISWRNSPVRSRQRIMFKLLELIHRDIDKLASIITLEQGKTLKDAFSEVNHGIELVEHACELTTLQSGEFSLNKKNGIDSYSAREPLGVCVGMCSFNFPAMIPLLMFPIAIACGNTFVLKPSERTPGACMHLAELAMEAGLPNGVLNVVHGTNDIIDAICDDDEIKAASYIGSDAPGMFFHARASANSKHPQTNVGAKSLAVVMPDANPDSTLHDIVCAGFGSAVQKSTEISTIIFVGGSKSWEDKLVDYAISLKVDAGIEPGADIGPVISSQVKDRASRVIQTFAENGARLILDGRNVMVPKYELGNFIGPTIVTDVTEGMDCYKEEILAPVVLCMQAGSLDEAISMVNRNKHGNGASIFTSSCFAARKFQIEVMCGQVGVNVAIPAPLPVFTFIGGSKAASFINGDINSQVNFYTKTKSVMVQWKDFCNSSSNTNRLPYNKCHPFNPVEENTAAAANNGLDFAAAHDASPLGLQLRDFSSTGEQVEDGGEEDEGVVSIPLHHEISGLAAGLSTINTGTEEGSHWTLHF